MQKVKYYKCPICKGKHKVKYNSLKLWGNHMLSKHADEIPPGYSIARYFYYIQTKKTHGTCVTCKQPTQWNEVTLKYNRYCEDPGCKLAYSRIAKDRMVSKYGKEHILDDPKQQRLMLSKKKTSGFYKFSNGHEIPYASSYELDFLTMLDRFLELPGSDIMGPSPHTYYYDYKNPKDKENEGRKFYIPDFYIPSLNLEIEIKQQTSGHQKINEITRPKEEQKDAVMNNNKSINYLKINDKNYTGFFKFLTEYVDKVETTLIKASERGEP